MDEDDTQEEEDEDDDELSGSVVGTVSSHANISVGDSFAGGKVHEIWPSINRFTAVHKETGVVVFATIT